MTSPYADLDRPPLSERSLRAALEPAWELRVVDQTASTNADVAAAARDGAAEGLVVVAEHQTAGRGRRGRAWVAPPRSALTLSILLRPRLPAVRWGWLPLLAGVAVADAVTARSGLDTRLKWPNDVRTADGDKLAGILSEVVDGAVVVGIGLNVTTTAEELEGLPAATSLRLAGAPSTDRDPLLRTLLRSLGEFYRAWHDNDGAPVAAYSARCETIGRRVRLELPGGGAVTGTATSVDADGRLVVRADDGTTTAYTAGDVVHLR